MVVDSEFRVYIYINSVLETLGWDTRNPARGGAVYTQGEFRKHDSLLNQALGREALRIPFLCLGMLAHAIGL